jgi:hypothetical protein
MEHGQGDTLLLETLLQIFEAESRAWNVFPVGKGGDGKR